MCVFVSFFQTKNQHHPREESRTTQGGEVKQHHPKEECSTTQKRRRKDSSTNGKEVVGKAPPPEREERDSHTSPKKGGTQPSLGGSAFPCSFWALLLFPSSVERVASHSLCWMLLFSSHPSLGVALSSLGSGAALVGAAFSLLGGVAFSSRLLFKVSQGKAKAKAKV